MALSGEDKLKKFATEVTNEARQISGQIEAQTSSELEEKTKSGKEQILAWAKDYIEQETQKIKKEASLEISRANINSKHDYFKYIDSVCQEVFDAVKQKLDEFAKSEDYVSYLFLCCKNVIENLGTNIGIFYMPEDERLVTEKIKGELSNLFELGSAEFIKDSTIRLGGLRFFDHEKNILINEVFEDKAERAVEMFYSLASPKFTSVK